jgi:hypothetical protein
MRKILSLTLVVAGLLALTPHLRADDRADALAVIEDAIKAHGGADALAKAQSFTRTGVGTVSGFGDKEMPMTDELTVSLPDRSRVAIEIDKKVKLVAVLNGDKGWESNGGPGTAATAARVQEMAEEMYVLWLTTLTPLKKNDYLLKVLPEKKVGDKPAVGVGAAAKGRPDVKLYFDKESHLLVKVEREAIQGGQKLDKEYLFGDYKDVDGVQLPRRLTEIINGKKLVEIKTAVYKLHKPDDAAFAKP